MKAPVSGPRALYFPDRAARDAIVARLARLGFPPVEPENPSWRQHGITIEDPDGWRVVLQNTRGLERPGSP